MLRVSIHAGLLADRSEANQLGALDIAYKKRAPMADYVTSMQLRDKGELQPAELHGYPRWSGSVWDLVARAITAILYRSAEAPPVPKVDKRCAYTTRMCAVVQRVKLDDRGVQIATAEILQPGRKRGVYRAELTEDLCGSHSAEFTYGTKRLDPSDLLLRAVCYAMWGTETLGARPTLALPPTMKIDGEERFDLQALTEPARTGFLRYMASRNAAAKPAAMPLGTDYVAFLTKG